ncbi:MAG: heavy metal-associated domain-containing protein [Gemmataceae bacterium]
MKKAITGVFAAAVLVLAAAANATEPKDTTITVEEMHCMSCARKMADKLYAVRGVGAVKADVPSARLFVTPKAGEAPSARGLWEAIEKAGYKPKKLESPAGTFTAKPAA